MLLIRTSQDINFRTVAAEAKVSTAWLYGQEQLRVRIMRARRTANHKVVPSAPAMQDRERLSTQNIVATLRLRIKTLEGEEPRTDRTAGLRCDRPNLSWQSQHNFRHYSVSRTITEWLETCRV